AYTTLFRSGLVVGALRVALLDVLDVGHQCLGPVDGGDADAEHADAEAESEEERRIAHAPQILERERDVGDDRPDRGERADREDERDQPFIGLGVPGVDISQSLAVLFRAGVLEELWLLRLRRSDVLLGAHEDFAPIQMAAPMRPPIPMIQTHRPSDTGPREPRLTPPGVGSRTSMR